MCSRPEKQRDRLPKFPRPPRRIREKQAPSQNAERMKSGCRVLPSKMLGMRIFGVAALYLHISGR